LGGAASGNRPGSAEPSRKQLSAGRRYRRGRAVQRDLVVPVLAPIPGSQHFRFGDGPGWPSLNRKYRDGGRRITAAWSFALSTLSWSSTTSRTRPSLAIENLAASAAILHREDAHLL